MQKHVGQLVNSGVKSFYPPYAEQETMTQWQYW